jgi:hypothetical protein
MYMRFGSWNVRSLHRTGALKTAARELWNYKSDLMGVEDVRWEKGATEWAEDCTLSTEKGMVIIS